MQSPTQLPPDVADRLAADRELLRGLRAAIARRIERDLMILDALFPDSDLEDDCDAEPSLCGVGSHEAAGNFPGYPVCGGGCGGNAVDLEHDEADGLEGDDERECQSTDDNGIGDYAGLWEQIVEGVASPRGFAVCA